MKPASKKSCSAAVLFAAVLLASDSLIAQTPKPGGCGATPVQMDNPHYLTVARVVLAARFPSGWELYEKKQNPFFLLRHGDQYATARTVMYIRVQVLDSSFEEAVRKDESDFRKDNPEVKIADEPSPQTLETGCPVRTQRFFYQDGKTPTVDRVTKIAIGKLLLNVVLSSDSDAEIDRYKDDYEYLLKNIAWVTGP